MIEEISLNNPEHYKLLRKLGMVRKHKKYLSEKLLREAYKIINPPNNEDDNKKL